MMCLFSISGLGISLGQELQELLCSAARGRLGDGGSAAGPFLELETHSILGVVHLVSCVQL